MLNTWGRWVVFFGLLIGTVSSYAHAQGAANTGSTPITTVIAEGLGATIDSAVQNAAQNALTQVVGSFVDTETQVAKHSEIADGIRHQTRDISNRTREYSQGSIKSFDVLDTRQDGAIVHVTAKVAVQVEVLHEQLKQALSGTAEVSKGLFAQAATAQTQQVNADAMFIDHIVTPLTEGVGLTLKVGAPVKFDTAHTPCESQLLPSSQTPASGEPSKPRCPNSFANFVRNRPLNDIYAVPVTLTADPGTATTLWHTATSMASAPCIRLNLRDPNPFGPLVKVFEEKVLQGDFWKTDAAHPKYRYVAVAQRTGESSFGEGCYRVLTDSAAYDEARGGFARYVFQVSVYNKQGTLVEQYLFHPYTDPRRGGGVYEAVSENEAVSLDFRPAIIALPVNNGPWRVDVFIPPKDQSFNLLVHVPIAVLAGADRLEIKVVSE